MRRSAWVVLLALGASGLGAGEVRGQSVPDPKAAGLEPRARLEQLVERVKWEQSRLKTLGADFVQDRVSQLLLEPETARGVFRYQSPDQVRWEYLEPRPILMTIRGEQMTTFFGDLGTAERVSIGSYSEQVFRYLGASGSLETLMKYFSLTANFPETDGEPYHLQLLPRYSRIKKRLRSMEIWLDTSSYLPVRLRYVEANGDSTDYRFENMVANKEMPASLFDVKLPVGTVVRSIDLRSGR